MHRRPTQSTGTFTRALLPPSRTIRSIIENPSTFTSIGVAMYAQCMHQLYIVLTCILGMHSVCTGGDGIETYYSVDRRGRGNAFDVVRQSGLGWAWVVGLGEVRQSGLGKARRGWARKGSAVGVWQGVARYGAAVKAWHGEARPGAARQSWCGVQLHGEVRRGTARQSRRGRARPGWARHGLVRQSGRVPAGCGMARHGEVRPAPPRQTRKHTI